MNFTKEQLEILSEWEKNFHYAVNADWSPNPGRTALQVIYHIYTSATGDTRRFSDNCNNCILSLLRDCGRIYFRDREELERQKAQEVEQKQQKPKKEVSVSPAPAKKVVRKKVTTKKK